MKSCLPALAVVLSLVALGAVFASDVRPGDVMTGSGPVRGKVEDGLRVFLGIPYAAPPVGNLRWRPPEPPAAWRTTRVCGAFGPACPQPESAGPGNYSEDCLSLNVWTGARGAADKLPVMVFIHGGGFQFGASSMPEYQGANLAKRGVVAVTVNYRLGPLGYLVHPALSAESPDAVSGNYGLLDQIAALKWVARNIAAFGGDPENVTVFGQSAGSRSVSLLTISPPAKGLFARAIAQSGGPIIGSEYLNPEFNGDAAAVSDMGRTLSARLGCDKTAGELACLRAKTPGEIIAAADTATSVFKSSLLFAPVFDGHVLPLDPAAAFRDPAWKSVPMIAGSTENEGTVYIAREQGLTLDRYREFLGARFGERADEAARVFPAKDDADVPRAIDFFLTVAANAQPARFMVRSLADKGTKAYLYRFSRKPATAKADKLGAFHGVDLAYVFGNMDRADGYTDTDYALSRLMMGYFVNFAATGNPNGPGLPVWPAFDPATGAVMDVNSPPLTGHHLYRAECDFIDSASRFGTGR